MRVKKNFGGKRAGYKGKKSKFKLSDLPIKTGIGLGMGAWNASDIYGILQHMGLFKHGGRVRGIGKAKRGFGKVLRKK